MSQSKQPDKQINPPAEIWDTLNPEQRRPVVSLLAQMVLKVFHSRSPSEESSNKLSDTGQRPEMSGENIDRAD